jgi:hypothetical protein
MDIIQQGIHIGNIWRTSIQFPLSSCIRRCVDSKVMATVFRCTDKPVYASIDTSVKTSILNKLILMKRNLK